MPTNILINGRMQANISAEDRGFNYGDGLFETLLIYKGEPQLLEQHWARLALGCRRLGIALVDKATLIAESMQLSRGCTRGVLKWTLTRGIGGRGYAAPSEQNTTRVVRRYAWPAYPTQNWRAGVDLYLCNTRLSMQPLLAGLKHLNRLEQILARDEWQNKEIAEGVMLDTQDRVIECTMSNIFFIRDANLITPDLSRCGVAGVMRQVILDHAQALGIQVQIRDVSLDELAQAQSLFVCNSVIGIWPVRRFNALRYGQNNVLQQLQRALQTSVYHDN